MTKGRTPPNPILNAGASLIIDLERNVDVSDWTEQHTFVSAFQDVSLVSGIIYEVNVMETFPSLSASLPRSDIKEYFGSLQC